jgi:hypothetical protein
MTKLVRLQHQSSVFVLEVLSISTSCKYAFILTVNNVYAHLCVVAVCVVTALSALLTHNTVRAALRALEHKALQTALRSLCYTSTNVEYLSLLFAFHMYVLCITHYRPGAYLFEVWLTLYKLLLSGLLVYFKPGTASQAVVALLITLLALWVSLKPQ